MCKPFVVTWADGSKTIGLKAALLMIALSPFVLYRLLKGKARIERAK